MRKDFTVASAKVVPTSVEDVLDQIFRYSRAIRRSGGSRRVAQATDYIEYDELGNNLSVKFRESVKIYLDRAAGNASSDVRGRLLDTICIRQQSFAFQRLRRASRTTSLDEKPAALPSIDSRSFSRAGSAFSMKKSETARKTQPTPSSILSSVSRKPKVAPSSATTLISTIVPSVEPQMESLEVTFSLEDLPRRPKIRRGQKEQECPYCFVMCPIEEFTDSAWPYVQNNYWSVDG